MPPESTTSESVLAPRAAIALLTLQLRASTQEAIAAERAVDEVDTAAAVSELRARIGPLVDDRRCALDDELAEAQSEMAAAIVAAQAEAEAIVAEATSIAARAAVSRAAEMTANHPVGHGQLVDRVIVDQATVDPARGSELVRETSLWAPPSTLGALASGLPAIPLTPNPDAGRPVTVVLDADSFARAFAIAIAPLLEDRLRASAHPSTQVVRVVQPAASAKKSFWRNAWHVDVVLSGIAMCIVLAVLVAWTN